MRRRLFQLGIIDRYLLRELAGSFAAVTLILLLVLVGGAATELLGKIARGRIPAELLLSLLGRLPAGGGHADDPGAAGGAAGRTARLRSTVARQRNGRAAGLGPRCARPAAAVAVVCAADHAAAGHRRVLGGAGRRSQSLAAHLRQQFN
ncbi:MAG: hypothetical protein KIS89_00765 [Dokdonella sp.]|nr:hypothetical protein [Dokdonella sp.]